jgi:hypothetical protein
VAVSVGGSMVALGVDSGAGVGAAGWQAAVRSRHPIKKNFLMPPGAEA